ncbi:prepilin-type N-terminal cleavage/methylation domain-containing protein [Motiliproteus sp.]|uniref:prepilin-type N-terminal cleavage/methylation domain-containing protein n=1 Tax=Motiliproteus sp. TaxID=1898955 RepID=UPI003BA85849
MHSNKPNQQGFTLLELIVVVGVLGLITAMATDFMVNQTNQQRFDTTKLRLEQIRYAIIGDSSRSLNGQPAFSGYIADTGRVPSQLRQLVSNDAYCTSDDSLTEAVCGADWFGGASNWKGPYLPISNGNDYLLDGWGNGSSDRYNFGWSYSGSAGSDITITSLGMDGSNGSSSTNAVDQSYEADQSLTILAWQYAGRNVDVGLTNNSADNDAYFCLVTQEPGGGSQTIDLNTTPAPTISATDVFGLVDLDIYKKDGVETDDCSAISLHASSSVVPVIAHNLYSLGAGDLEVTIN